MAIQIWGSGQYEKPALSGQPHEAGLLKLDISKALSALSWKPRYTSAVAIAKTLEWYRAYAEKPAGIKEFTMKQIQDYQQQWN
jgi:CDP-glucose 4,6-dehydratase